jgi:hypothetical protein
MPQRLNMISFIIQKFHPELQLLSSRLPPHNNVVQFLGFKKDKLFYSLVMPWMADGTLTSFIRTHGAVLETPAKTTLVSCLQLVWFYSEIFLFSCTTFPLALNTVRCLLSYETTEASDQV